MNRTVVAFFGVLSAARLLAAESSAGPGGREMVDFINPLIGASTSREHGEGKTFPGAATPFGLVQLSPDTITGGDNGPGYSWEHTSIEGFSFTHMSGIGWYGDLGNLMTIATTGALKTASGKTGGGDGYRSRFRHETEIAQAGYYAVTLDDYGVRAELAAAPRAGMIRFTFPRTETARIQIDLARRIAGTSVRQRVAVVDERTVEGWMKCTPEGGGWGDGAGRADYTVYFSVQFSRPLTNAGVWSADIPDGWKRKLENVPSAEYQAAVARAEVLRGCRGKEGKHLGFFTEFATAAGEQVLMKAGLSFVSVEGARANLAHDIDHWDFDRVHAGARARWADAFAGVAIEGATDAQKEIFATALYHTMIDPRSFSDVDGRYTGADGKIHTAEDFTYRTVFSGWDVFRSQFPLQSLINPGLVTDTIRSLMQQAELSGNGYLARWELLAVESGCMIGDPAISVIAQARLMGLRGFDAGRAYGLCRQTALGPRTHRSQWEAYNRLGYVPGSVSWTLENAYFDYCAGRLAESLGRADDAALFLGRALNYRNIYDPSVGNMRAKNAAGNWTEWEGATAHGQGCVESNPYQQGWFVPHDVQGLIDLMGEEHFIRHLDEFFEKTPPSFKWNDYYNHANEPVHHVPYLFVYAGRPWLTQKWVRFALDHAYGTGVKGLCGNEDVGQMSAWYVLGAIGLHPVSPADNVYVIGSPLFRRTTIRLDPRHFKGGSFSVVAHRRSPGDAYVQSARLNGQPLNRAWLRTSEITAGGTLELEMGPEPNREWGAAPSERPPSLSPPKRR